MAWSLQPLLEWMDDEWDSAQVKLKWLVKDMWWAAVLAAVICYFEGGTGGMRQFVKTMFMIRLMKLPLDMWMWLQTDVLHWMNRVMEKVNYIERRQMMIDGMQSIYEHERNRRPAVQ